MYLNKTNSTYLNWLHELTGLGYDEKPMIVIPTSAGTLVQGYYNSGMSTQAAMEEYKKTLAKDEQ